MRTKEQHEREKQLVGELKKLELRIKKEEKEEKNFRKLIYDDHSFPVPPQISNPQVIDGEIQAAAVEEGG